MEVEVEWGLWWHSKLERRRRRRWPEAAVVAAAWTVNHRGSK